MPINRIVPNRELATIEIPDSTPEIVGAYALNDEQALLARLRYNRLIDVFLGVTAYSLQNHLRTSVVNIGQIEIDEVYVGIDRHGAQYVIPVQAKGGKDQLSVVQTKQDLAFCAEKFPDLICRSVSAQFMDDERMALFELTVQDGGSASWTKNTTAWCPSAKSRRTNCEAIADSPAPIPSSHSRTQCSDPAKSR